MRFKIYLLLLLSTSMLGLQGKTYQVYFLAGQSNMEGHGFVRDLTPEQRKPQPTIMIYHGNPVLDDQTDGGIGMWADLRPGHGYGFKTDGISNYYSLRFGPELSFGRTIASLSRQPVAIIKYAVGGTGLSVGSGYGNWSPGYKDGQGINQFDNALQAIKTALSDTDIDNDGQEDTLVAAGIIWMQGEADSHSAEAHAKAYDKNFKELMALFRTVFKTSSLPVVIGKITRANGDQMPYYKLVQKAHEDFVKQDTCAAYVSDTETYGKIDDGWHYDSKGFWQLGEAFAQAMHKLKTNCLGPY